MTQAVRVHNFMVSSDGYGSGVGQSLEHPFGHANPADLFSWAGATAHWVNRTDPGGTYGFDDYCTRDFTRNIGVEIMGRNKFGPSADRGQILTGKGGGATTHRSIRRCSCSRIMYAPQSPWGTPRSIFSTLRPRTHSRRRSRQPMAKTCASAVASPRCANFSTLISLTKCISRLRPSS